MKKAIKIIAIILLVVSVIAAVVVCVTSDYFADKPWTEISIEELETYINEKVIPIVVLVFTAIGTILMALLPVINGIKKASEKFSAAEEGIKSTSAETSRTQEESKKLFEQAKEYFEETLSVSKNMEKKMEELSEMESRIEEMMRIGFCNTPSLVRSGYAKKIYDMSSRGSKNAENRESDQEKQIPVENASEAVSEENGGEKREDTDDAKEA